eukprot:symbB.v1.2.040257.t1/scaffold7091.1/size13379/2
MPDEDDQGEEDEEEELMEKIEVEKPKFFHGPRLPLCTDDSSEQRTYSLLCYNDAHDLVFVVEGSSILAYSGEELVTKCKDVASSSKVPVAPKCRITTPDRPKMITTNEEGTIAMLCVVCAKTVLVYLVADVEKGTAKEVCSNMVGGDEISMATWKEDTLVSVYKSGRVETLDPGHGGNNNMIHENTEFAPSCAASLPRLSETIELISEVCHVCEYRSDIALLGGKPTNEEQSNLWAVDVLAGVSWQVYIDDVPTSMEDAFYYGKQVKQSNMSLTSCRSRIPNLCSCDAMALKLPTPKFAWQNGQSGRSGLLSPVARTRPILRSFTVDGVAGLAQIDEESWDSFESIELRLYHGEW